MTNMDEGALDRLCEAVGDLYDPVERLRLAVNAAFADAAKRPGGDQELHMRLMDVNAQARALRARAESRYGPAEALFDRAQADGSDMSALWC